MIVKKKQNYKLNNTFLIALNCFPGNRSMIYSLIVLSSDLLVTIFINSQISNAEACSCHPTPDFENPTSDIREFALSDIYREKTKKQFAVVDGSASAQTELELCSHPARKRHEELHGFQF